MRGKNVAKSAPGKELNLNRILLFVYCSKCHKYQPLRQQSFRHPKLKGYIDVLSCGVCDIVQNLTRIPKVKEFKYRDLKKKGWYVTEYQSKKKKNLRY